MSYLDDGKNYGRSRNDRKVNLGSVFFLFFLFALFLLIGTLP